MIKFSGPLSLLSFRAEFRALVIFAAFFVASMLLLRAQVAPSHDPSRIVRNTGGRYWKINTGNGSFTQSWFANTSWNLHWQFVAP